MFAKTFTFTLDGWNASPGEGECYASFSQKTFKTTVKSFNAVFQDTIKTDNLWDIGVQQKFNLEKVAWWGGVFELMAKSTKRCLRKMVGWAKLSLDELHTVIAESSLSSIQGLCHMSRVRRTFDSTTSSHRKKVINLQDNLGTQSTQMMTGVLYTVTKIIIGDRSLQILDWNTGTKCWTGITFDLKVLVVQWNLWITDTWGAGILQARLCKFPMGTDLSSVVEQNKIKWKHYCSSNPRRNTSQNNVHCSIILSGNKWGACSWLT